VNLSPFSLVIFDADNTLRRTLVEGQPCPRAPHEWELIPGTREKLAEYDWRGDDRRFAIASNQDQVAYGLISDDMARQLLCDMVKAAIGEAAERALIRYCPHAEDAACGCRKPQPGLLLDLSVTTNVAPAAALFVGDGDVDREAARRAGMHFAWAAEFFGR
jgi:D-glycero-D-manno-heptose 1,7-bisphosphate phosphatase